MRRAGVSGAVVIGHKNHIGGAVVDEWATEGDDCPFVSGKGDAAAEHLVESRDSNPVRIAREAALVGVLHVEV